MCGDKGVRLLPQGTWAPCIRTNKLRRVGVGVVRARAQLPSTRVLVQASSVRFCLPWWVSPKTGLEVDWVQVEEEEEEEEEEEDWEEGVFLFNQGRGEEEEEEEEEGRKRGK